MIIVPTITRAARSGTAATAPVRNRVLAALATTDYTRLSPKLEHVTLVRGETIYQMNQNVEEVYFPEEAVVAMVDTMANGRTVEVGVIGREGVVGINVFLGGAVTSNKAVVQLSGSAMRMQSNQLRKEMHLGGPLQQLLLAYSRAFLAVLSQSVACCQYHNIEQRVARWLLTMNEHAASQEFQMNQNSIALMLGVRREGITEAAGALQAAALISYRRGRIRVLDEMGLGKRACECYRFIAQQYGQLYGDRPRFLSRRSQ